MLNILLIVASPYPDSGNSVEYPAYCDGSDSVSPFTEVKSGFYAYS